ncbi:MAG TPA: TetR/AcrR family transcriptional regulator [Ligilactobacillus acidipiscis]|uniref:TetR/AcrR family transcriptional regulator n=1 Tax=Ligilactobacillus acidipiscis TaxID=89059 RepID=A0A921F6V4_9LACO|nr:TetR/AcrR family transcriptional regulator [Ligilactobacillus acidipiscis]
MNKQPKVTEKTRRSFVEAFCQLYLEKPIDKISIRDITTLAGYNRSTFYLYFSDIYTLRTFVEDDLLDYVQVNLSKDDPKLKTEQGMLSKLLFLFEHKENELKAVLGPYGNLNFIGRLKKIIVSTSTISDNFVPEVPADDKYFAYFLECNVSIALNLFQLWLKRGKDLSKEELVSLSYQLYKFGVQGTKRDKQE